MDERDLNTKVSLLERDNGHILVLIEKMNTTMNKLTELSSSIKEMLAVQEHRLNNHDIHYENTQKMLEKHNNKIEQLDRWRWYQSGAIALFVFLAGWLKLR